jgi:TatA/E family protein of Tat protein translocase
MPFNIGAPELIIILIIALIVLGPGKLPDVASSLGRSLREFRKAATEVSEAGRLDVPPASAPTPSMSSAPGASSAPAGPSAPNTVSGAADPNTLKPAGPASDPDRP